MARPRSNSTSESSPVLKVALALGGAGAVVILLPLLGDGATVGGLVAVVAATVLAAPYAEQPGAALPTWWTLMAAGAVLALIGLPLALAVETLGGLFTAFGGILVAVAVAFALPGRAASRSEPGREDRPDRRGRNLAARRPRVVEHHRGGDLGVVGRCEGGEPGVEDLDVGVARLGPSSAVPVFPATCPSAIAPGVPVP